MDLEPIEERANEFATWVGKFDSAHRIPAAFASAADVPALLAEVERLRAEAARPAPAWDEDAKREGAIKALRDAAEEMTELGLEEYTARDISDWLSGHADCLAAEGGADRG